MTAPASTQAGGRAYYNEIDRDAAHVLRCLIADGLIAPGDVDDRSIKDVQPNDLDGYTQCHFFAGAGIWSVAARLAGWPDARPLWTGSCPCQPFSAAGKGGGVDDPRHLWPDFFRLIRAVRPAVVVGEQVAGAPGYGWFDGVRSDLEAEDYASGQVDIPACAMDAPHIRQRLYWCALEYGPGDGRQQGFARSEAARYGRQSAAADRGIDGAMADTYRPRSPAIGRDAGEVSSLSSPQRGADDHASLSGRGDASLVERVADADPRGRAGRTEASQRGALGRTADERATGVTLGDASGSGQQGQQNAEWLSASSPRWTDAQRADRRDSRPNGSAWAGADWILCHDGKARRTEPGLRLLVDGMAGRVPAWRLGGNAIVAPLAAEVIGALIDVLPAWPNLRSAA